MTSSPARAVPAVGAVVRHEGSVLAVRDRRRQAWTIPLGRVDAGESVRQAVRREVREEADVEVSIDRLAGVYSDPGAQTVELPSGEPVQYVTTVVVCTHDSGTPAGDGAETVDARYFPRAEFPEMNPLDEWVRDALDGGTPVLA